LAVIAGAWNERRNSWLTSARKADYFPFFIFHLPIHLEVQQIVVQQPSDFEACSAMANEK
jgi:hypothetical protein